MKDPEEIIAAADALGAAVQDAGFADYMWGGPATEASTRALFMLLTLGWVMDIDPEMFDGILAAVKQKRKDYEKEKTCLRQLSSSPQSRPSSRRPRSN